MKYILYQTVNKVNNKVYIGVHGTETPESFDGYLGNGISIYRPSTYMNPNTYFQRAVKKYGVKNFIRTTLAVFDDEQSAYDLEAKLVNLDFLKRTDTYNMALGGKLNYDNLHNPMKKVYMYDLEGNFVREFIGINIAARTIHPIAPNGSHISRAIKTGGLYQGYLWSYEKVPCMKPRTAKKVPETVAIPYTGNKVCRCDDAWNILEVFETLTDCRKAGYKNALEVLKGKREHCKGYRFKYLN